MQNSLSTHLSAFSEPRFRRYFPSSCASTLGGWIIRFLFGWSAWELTHSATWVGIVAGCMLLPAFLLSPLFGIVSDRINPRNGLMVTVSVQGLIATIGGSVIALEWYNLSWLLTLSLALGMVTAAHTPIRLSLIPRLVTRQALPSAIGYSAIIFNSSRIIGPAIGAWLLLQGTLAFAFFSAIPLFICGLLLLLTVKNIDRGDQRIQASLTEELRDGLRYARAHLELRLVFGFTLMNALMGRTVIELLPALSGQLLDGDSSSLATLTATAGAGSIIGGLIISRQGSNEKRLLKLVSLSLITGAVGLLQIRWLQGLPALCCLILLLGMITTISGTGNQALTQLKVADAYRGRVLSLWTMLAMGVPAIGAVVVGSLADILGFTSVLTGLAIFTIAGIAILQRTGNQADEAPGAD